MNKTPSRKKCLLCQNDASTDSYLCSSCARSGAITRAEQCPVCHKDDAVRAYHRNDGLVEGSSSYTCHACGSFGMDFGHLTDEGIKLETALANAEDRPIPFAVQMEIARRRKPRT